MIMNLTALMRRAQILPLPRTYRRMWYFNEYARNLAKLNIHNLFLLSFTQNTRGTAPRGPIFSASNDVYCAEVTQKQRPPNFAEVMPKPI